MKIGVKWDSRELETRLTGLAGALKDLRPVWPDIHKIFLDFMVQVFAKEGAFGDPPDRWAPLNPQYAAWKHRHYPGRPILQREGTLMASLTQEQAPHHVYRVGPGFMETGTSVAYARAHQWGYPPRHLPARPMIKGFTKAEGERMADAVLTYLLKSMRRGAGARIN